MSLDDLEVAKKRETAAAGAAGIDFLWQYTALDILETVFSFGELHSHLGGTDMNEAQLIKAALASAGKEIWTFSHVLHTLKYIHALCYILIWKPGGSCQNLKRPAESRKFRRPLRSTWLPSSR